MKIKIEFTSLLYIRGIKSGDWLDLPDQATARDALNLCKIREEHQRYIIPFINGQEGHIDDPLRDQDTLKLFLPVGGG
jgi:hypothetical protein